MDEQRPAQERRPRAGRQRAHAPRLLPRLQPDAARGRPALADDVPTPRNFDVNLPHSF